MTVIVVFSHSIEWRCHYFSSTMCTRLPHVWCKTTYEARRVNSCWENAEYWRLRHSYLNLMLQRLIALISPKWGKLPWQQYGRWGDEMRRGTRRGEETQSSIKTLRFWSWFLTAKWVGVIQVQHTQTHRQHDMTQTHDTPMTDSSCTDARTYCTFCWENRFRKTVWTYIVCRCVHVCVHTCRYCCAYVQLLSFSRFFPPFLFSVFHFSSFLFQPPKTSSIKLKFSLTKFSLVTLFYYTVHLPVLAMYQYGIPMCFELSRRTLLATEKVWLLRPQSKTISSELLSKPDWWKQQRLFTAMLRRILSPCSSLVIQTGSRKQLRQCLSQRNLSKLPSSFENVLGGSAAVTNSELTFYDGGCMGNLTEASAVCSQGGTVVHATIASGRTEGDYLMFTVEYRARSYAFGRIPKTTKRREMHNVDEEILVARVIDRAVRPLFKDDYLSEVQMIVTAHAAGEIEINKNIKKCDDIEQSRTE